MQNLVGVTSFHGLCQIEVCAFSGFRNKISPVPGIFILYSTYAVAFIRKEPIEQLFVLEVNSTHITQFYIASGIQR